MEKYYRHRERVGKIKKRWLAIRGRLSGDRDIPGRQHRISETSAAVCYILTQGKISVILSCLASTLGGGEKGRRMKVS